MKWQVEQICQICRARTDPPEEPCSLTDICSFMCPGNWINNSEEVAYTWEKSSQLLILGRKAARLSRESNDALDVFYDALADYIGVDDIYEVDDIGYLDGLIDTVVGGDGTLDKNELEEIIRDIRLGFGFMAEERE